MFYFLVLKYIPNENNINIRRSFETPLYPVEDPFPKEKSKKVNTSSGIEPSPILKHNIQDKLNKFSNKKELILKQIYVNPKYDKEELQTRKCKSIQPTKKSKISQTVKEINANVVDNQFVTLTKKMQEKLSRGEPLTEDYAEMVKKSFEVLKESKYKKQLLASQLFADLGELVFDPNGGAPESLRKYMATLFLQISADVKERKWIVQFELVHSLVTSILDKTENSLAATAARILYNAASLDLIESADSASEFRTEQKWCRLRIIEWGGLAVLINYFNSEGDTTKLKLSKKILKNVLYTLRIVTEAAQDIHARMSLPSILESEQPIIKRSASPYSINEFSNELKKLKIVQKNVSYPDILLQTINVKELQVALEEELAVKRPNKAVKAEDIAFQKPTKNNYIDYKRPNSIKKEELRRQNFLDQIKKREKEKQARLLHRFQEKVEKEKRKITEIERHKKIKEELRYKLIEENQYKKVNLTNTYKKVSGISASSTHHQATILSYKEMSSSREKQLFMTSGSILPNKLDHNLSQQEVDFETLNPIPIEEFPTHEKNKTKTLLRTLSHKDTAEWKKHRPKLKPVQQSIVSIYQSRHPTVSYHPRNKKLESYNRKAD